MHFSNKLLPLQNNFFKNSSPFPNNSNILSHLVNTPHKAPKKHRRPLFLNSPSTSQKLSPTRCTLIHTQLPKNTQKTKNPPKTIVVRSPARRVTGTFTSRSIHPEVSPSQSVCEQVTSRKQRARKLDSTGRRDSPEASVVLLPNFLVARCFFLGILNQQIFQKSLLFRWY